MPLLPPCTTKNPCAGTVPTSATAVLALPVLVAGRYWSDSPDSGMSAPVGLASSTYLLV